MFRACTTIVLRPATLWQRWFSPSLCPGSQVWVRPSSSIVFFFNFKHNIWLQSVFCSLLSFFSKYLYQMPRINYMALFSRFSGSQEGCCFALWPAPGSAHFSCTRSESRYFRLAPHSLHCNHLTLPLKLQGWADWSWPKVWLCSSETYWWTWEFHIVLMPHSSIFLSTI